MFDTAMEEKFEISSSAIPDPSLEKIKNGKKAILNRQEIFQYNLPNYPFNDILVDSVEIEAHPYDPEKKSNFVHTFGRCVNFQQVAAAGGGFPELRWEHMNATLLSVIITQAGRTSHNFCSDGRNGVALRTMDMVFRRAVPLGTITFDYDSEIYIRKNEVWADSKWKFYCEEVGKKFADFTITSRGVYRDYTGVESGMQEALKISDTVIGKRMVFFKVITPWQKDKILEMQEKLKERGVKKRFGQLAVEAGFCTDKQLEECLFAKNNQNPQS